MVNETMKTAYKIFNRHTYRSTGTDLDGILQAAKDQGATIRKTIDLTDIEFDDGSIIVVIGSIIICDALRRAPYPYAYD